MKKTFSLIISIILVLTFAAFPAEAKILNQCHYCGGDGIYTCDAKDCNNGRITCGRCGGTGQTKEKCGECGGTGKCRVCQGTGKRLGDNTIDCDNCKGTGNCQGGPGWGACTQGYYHNKCQDCNGEGTVWHNSEWCKYARTHGGKCPICKGTGYEGDGVEGTPNDGVSNVPRAGDGIYYLDGSYAIYGGGSSGGNSSGGSSSDKKTVSTDSQKSNTNASYELLPADKHTTMYLGTPSVENDDFAGTTATGVVRYKEMTDDQKAVYDSLSDEKLDKLLVNVRDIITTVKVGEISDESQGSVDAFCQANGIKDFADANILSVSFDGHIEIGFPILVSVEVDPDMFDGSKPMHVFHIKEDGLVLQISDEDISCIKREEDGKISRIEFYTDSFSDFLLSDAEGLVAPTDIKTESAEDSYTAYGGTGSFNSAIIFVLIAVLVLIAAAVIVFFALKKRRAVKSVDAMQDPENPEG